MTEASTFDQIVDDARVALEYANGKTAITGIRYDSAGERLTPDCHRFAYFVNDEEAGCVELFRNGFGLIGFRVMGLDAQIGATAWLQDVIGPTGITARSN